MLPKCQMNSGPGGSMFYSFNVIIFVNFATNFEYNEILFQKDLRQTEATLSHVKKCIFYL